MSEAELAARIEKLERDNRRLKRLGAAALVLVAGLGLMAATRPVPRLIKAHEFEVVGSSGQVRVRMKVSQHGANPGDAEITLFDGRGVERAYIGVTKLGVGGIALPGHHGFGGVDIAGPPPREVANWGIFPSEGIYISEHTSPQDPGQKGVPFLGGPGMAMNVAPTGRPAFRLFGPQGFEMDLGSTITQTIGTGATQQTSADSIVMFGNDKNGRVIWHAP